MVNLFRCGNQSGKNDIIKLAEYTPSAGQGITYKVPSQYDGKTIVVVNASAFTSSKSSGYALYPSVSSSSGKVSTIDSSYNTQYNHSSSTGSYAHLATSVYKITKVKAGGTINITQGSSALSNRLTIYAII